MLMLKVINCVIDHIWMALMHVNIKGWTSGREQGLRPRLVLLFFLLILIHQKNTHCLQFLPTVFWQPQSISQLPLLDTLLAFLGNVKWRDLVDFFFFTGFWRTNQTLLFYLFRMLQCVCVCKNKTLQEYQCFEMT